MADFEDYLYQKTLFLMSKTRFLKIFVMKINDESVNFQQGLTLGQRYNKLYVQLLPEISP